MLTTAHATLPRPGWAWERFTSEGPLALLPQGVREVQVSYPDERTAQMEIHYIDGQRSLMRGEMRGERLDLYLDDRLVSTLSREQRDAAASRGAVQA